MVVAAVSTFSSPPALETSLTGAGRYSFARLTAMAVSPVSDRFAVADENLSRVFIFQSSGRLDVVIGETGFLTAPRALCFEDDATLLVVTKDRLVLRIADASPEECDTVADLKTTTRASQLKSVSHVIKDRTGFLVLDPELGQITQLDTSWTFVRTVIGHGHGVRGKVWEPTDLERDLAGKLIVADRGDFPVQVFATTGTPLFVADWNTPAGQQSWEATAVAVTRQEMIWVADSSNRRWRIYDQTGTLAEDWEFPSQVWRPSAASVTVDNRLVVVEERGLISIWSLLP